MAVNAIAIDGPAASGKSSAAQMLAEAIPGAIHINTGSMYRAAAWKALRLGIDPKNPDPAKLDDMLANTTMRFIPGADGLELEVDGAVPGDALRTPEISAGASAIAAVPAVRAKLVEWQRKMADGALVVMEGRDIGTVVFPDAKYKFFLTASPEARAKRRLLQDGGTPSEEEIARVAAEIVARDKADSTRAVGPLRQAEDAVPLDNSGMNLRETIDFMLRKIRNKVVLSYRVPYADTDQMGVVYYANYFEYFERFRNELLRETGHTYLELEKEGIAMPVIEANCRYKASARYDDVLDITGCFAEASGVRVKIACQIFCRGKLLVEGFTIHACVDMKTGRPARPPRFIRELVEAQ